MDATNGPRGQFGGSAKNLRATKPRRPNYNAIHSQPLPVKVYPIPPLIPNNPLSILHIAYVYISQWIFPPLSHPPEKFRGYFSPETRSIHITDDNAMRALWESGFFGKGSLSRSEPTWLEREKRRKGMPEGETSEEMTRQRREKRKEFKNERARKEREAIEERLRLERGCEASGEQVVENHAEPVTTKGLSQEEVIGRATGHAAEAKADSSRAETNMSLQKADKDVGTPSPTAADRECDTTAATAAQPEGPDPIENQEHLQLMLEEAFFLVYGLGVLSVLDLQTSAPMSTLEVFNLCRQNSSFPPQPPNKFRPDDRFLTSYVVYHHFRSLGWVVRSGVKFAVDYLLYSRGPAFSHAEFAVVIVPSYSHPYWSDSEEKAAQTGKKESKTWWWLHCINRVQSQVRKSLVLVFVEIPPLEEHKNGEPLNIGRLLKRYHVRELTLRRWIPNRSRD